MVKVGDFSLELVDATTKVPFKEHVAPSDGQSYAGKFCNHICLCNILVQSHIHTYLFCYV